MAAFTSKTAVIMLAVMFGMMALSGPVVEAIEVGINNYLKDEALQVHCKSADDDLGAKSIPYTLRYAFDFTQNFFGTTLYSCEFSAPGFPTTNIDVFKGVSYRAQVCNCLGVSRCEWVVQPTGFWCNTGFIQNWGWATIQHAQGTWYVNA